MASKKKHSASRRTQTASSKAEWSAHIQSLGLSSPGEYQEWCRRHGQPFHRRKTWRQERHERRIAEREREETVLRRHLGALGLDSVPAYLDWCRSHGFPATTRKSLRKLQGEVRCARDRARKAVSALRETVGDDHLRALGLDSVEAYREWCRNRDLNPSQFKSPGELKNEQALAALNASRQQGGRVHAVIERIHAGTVGEGELKSVVLLKVRAAFAGLADGEREACRLLLLHVERHADLLSTAPGALRWGRSPGNTLVEGVLALARHHGSWIGPVESWRPESRVQYEQFAALARHLLARYPVPDFMDSVWFLEEGEEARRQKRWYVHIAQGGNIRTADVPVELTKKMAHEFLQAPEHYTVEEALRFGQVMGQGGHPALAEAVAATHLGRSFEHEEFWSKVVQFLAQHPELEMKWVTGIVAYIHHRKFEPLGGGDPVEPNFSMKSRSVPKLLDQVERWRKHWTREARASQAGGRDNDPGPQYAPYYVEERDRWGNNLRWTIAQLTTARALAAEGEAMSHCVGSYADKLDKMSIWSLKVQENDRVYHVLTISIDLQEGYISQVRGRFNVSEGESAENRGRSKTRLSKREHRYLGAARDHLDAWLAREGIAYMQAYDSNDNEADRREFWERHQWEARIGAVDE